jgi:hypothetical protein
MENGLSHLMLSIKSVRPTLSLRPHTGRLWLDLLYLLVIGALHHTVLPSLSRSLVVVDLMTPWLIACFVTETLPRGALLGLVGAMIVETHSAAPAGLYVCAYWVIAVVLYLTRSTLSWRHAFPWVVTFAVGELWVVGFESFVTAVNAGGQPTSAPLAFVDWSRLALGGTRVIIAVALGMLISQRLRTIDFEEDAT